MWRVLIDATLKSDESEVEPFSNFSGKAKTKATRDIFVLYAFDLEEMEPICSKCSPGNMHDAAVYEAFLSENQITKGILVGDKGFPSSSIVKYKDQHPDLHYLNPLRRNAKLISWYPMLDFTEGLAGADLVTCQKAKCFDKNKWLYSFRDGRLAGKEEHDWIQRNVKNRKYSLEEFRKKQPEFGTIVLESDPELSPEAACQSYLGRWEIEPVMRYCKHACEFHETRVQDDYSVIGSEFCDFLSSVIPYRLINKYNSSVTLKNRKIIKSYGNSNSTRILGLYTDRMFCVIDTDTDFCRTEMAEEVKIVWRKRMRNAERKIHREGFRL